MNSHAMMLGGLEDGGGIDKYTLACIRPKLVGGTYVPGDVSQHNHTVTNTGISVIDGPWGDSNGGLYDAGNDVACYTPGTSLFSATSVRDIDFWLMVLERPSSSYNKVVFRLGATGIEYPGFAVYYGAGSTGKIRFLISSRLNISTQFTVYSGDYDYGNIWRHIRVRCPVGTGKFSLYIGGRRIGDTAAHTPNFGATPSLLLGAEKLVSSWPQNSISKMAEVRISSVVRWTKNFVVPSGPYAISGG